MLSVGGGKGKGRGARGSGDRAVSSFSVGMSPIPTNIWAACSPTPKEQEVLVAETMWNARDKNNYLNQYKSQCLCWFKMLCRSLYRQGRTGRFPLYLLPK